MSEKPGIGKIVPNSFQTPNVLVDEYMRYLLPNEVKCYLVVDRKTLGWLKREDNIALSKIVEYAGINIETARTCMAELCLYGLTVKTGENDPTKNYGDQYALQFDENLVNLDGLIARHSQRKEKSVSRMAKIRSRIKTDPTLLDSTTPPTLINSATPDSNQQDHPDSIGKSPQKTLSKDTIKSSATPKNKRLLGTQATPTTKRGDALDWLLQSGDQLAHQKAVQELQQRFERASGLNPKWDSVKDGWLDFTGFLIEKDALGETIEKFYAWFNQDKFRKDNNLWMKPERYKFWWGQAFPPAKVETSIKVKAEPTPFELAVLRRGSGA